MLIGAHVSAAGGPLRALERAEEMGAAAVQLHTQSPRAWRSSGHSEESFEAYRVRAQSSPVKATLCHASYLINLATSDASLLDKSRSCLVENLRVASGIGAKGLVLHLGSHRGRGLESCIGQVAAELRRALDRDGAASRRHGADQASLLLENAAGAGGTLGRSFEELAAVIAAAAGDERLGACLDTQHLFASGVAYETLGDADRAVERLDATIGLGRLGCVHLNDSAVELGSNRDRHANLGEGCIGRRALGNLISHPGLADLPVVLEVPGQKRAGPARADLDTARRILAAGQSQRLRALALP